MSQRSMPVTRPELSASTAMDSQRLRYTSRPVELHCADGQVSNGAWKITSVLPPLKRAYGLLQFARRGSTCVRPFC